MPRNDGGYFLGNQQGVYSGGGLIFKASITVHANDPLLELLSRSTKVGEKPSMGVRRCLTRFGDILDRTLPPPGDMVSIIHAAASTSPHILHGLSYAQKDVIAKTVRGSSVPQERRMAALSYLERISYAEYARLLEAVEMLAA